MNDLTPVLFVSHGSPMLALDLESAQEYRAWSESLPIPKAILIISAHWETSGLVLGETVKHEKLIYDFYGFPEPLYQLQYPAPGAEWLVDEIQNVFGQDIPQQPRGLDHGVWVPLLHMWPEANVPILQLSLPANYTDRALFELGRRLEPLRQQGVMIIGAGTLSHNLREGLSGKYSATPEWVYEFDNWLVETLAENRLRLSEWQSLAPHAQLNHPTPEHFRPLLIVVGAAKEDESFTYPITGFDMGVFSKRSIQFG